VLAGLEVDLLLSLRSAPRARALLAGIESDQPLVALARARLALVVGDHRTAQRLAGARRWDERCSSRVRTDLKLTYAAATLASGDEATAVADLERLLTLAEVGSYRPFALVPPDLLTAAAELLPPLEKVVHVLEDAGVRGVLHRQDEMVELTPREQVVLEAIATSRTIEDIARSLHVSVNTVKSQTRSLYRKLGVRSRDEAVHSASIRGVLPPRDGSEAPG
jgi:LuxR family maltose regulon positive regulatory protein